MDFSGIFIAGNGEAFGQPVVGYVGDVNVLNAVPFGLFVRNPLAGTDLRLEGVAFLAGALGVTFHGDMTSILAGRSVWLNDVEHAPNGDWYFDLTAGVTFASFSAPDLLPGERYVLEVR